MEQQDKTWPLSGMETVKIETGFFQGEKKLQESLRNSIIHACQQGANTLILCDADFALWPLSDEDVIIALKQWANSTSNRRTLIMLAATYRMIEANHSLWVRWRQTWNQRVQCKQVREGSDPNLPCIFWSDVASLIVQNKDTCTGNISTDRHSIVVAKAQLDELERKCKSAFPASVAGLW